MKSFDWTKCQERTRDIYERLPGYPSPPLIPLPDPNDVSALHELGIVNTPLSRFLVRVALRAAGFRAFRKQLPHHLEELLRRSNLRGAGLFALVNSATLALQDDPRGPDPLERAATLILAARSFYRELWSGRLQPDRFQGHPLEMGQYPNFFSTCLTIEHGNARLFKSSCTALVNIVIRGQYFQLHVGEMEHDPPVEALVPALQRVVRTAREATDDSRAGSPGILTAAMHKTQLKVFREFLREPLNRESFHRIRHGFFTLCLDLDTYPENEAEAARQAHAMNLHNRWYHSSVQVVVFGNAKTAVICNFNTYVDGNPMMRFGAELYARALRVPVTRRNEEASPAPLEVEPLPWVVKKEWQKQAEKDVKWVTDDQPATFVIDGIGQQSFIPYNLKPVPIFVIALQMAIQQVMGRPLPIAQYLTLSRYRCMDLAIALVATPEVNRFVQYVLHSDRNREKSLQMLQMAIRSQQQAAREARRYLSLQKMLSLFLVTRNRRQRIYVMAVAAMAFFILRLLGYHKPRLSDVVLSHPAIYPEVPIIGRPGIRLPYVRYLGLHYQIMKDRIVLTFMPGLRWTVPNARLVQMLHKSLEEILKLVVPRRFHQMAH